MNAVADTDRTVASGRALAWRALPFVPVLVFMAWFANSVYWQCDDAYISFRYVWNLVNGHGLVFNQGERVEGYTNFAWVLELAVIWRVLGVRPEVACDVLSTLCTIGTLAVLFAFAYRGPWRERRTWAAFGALVLLASNRTWAVWCTSGLETRQFTFFVLLGAYLVHIGRGHPRRLILASLAFSVAEDTRPEGSLLWAMAGVWLLSEMAIERRFAWRDVLAYGVPLVVLVGAHFLWRHGYYGDWLPNTYYAKFVRAWPEAGWRYFAAAAIETGAWLLIPIAIVGAVARIRCGDRTHLLLAIVIAAHVAYLVRIGGDHFELRPLDFYWPPLALASAEGMIAIAATIGHWAERKYRARASRVELTAAGVLLAIGVVYGSAVQKCKADWTQTLVTRGQIHFMQVHLDRHNSPALFALPFMSPLVAAYNDLVEYTLQHGVGTVWREHSMLWRDEMRKWSPYGAVRGTQLLPPDAVTARGSIGVFGYYVADLVIIDQNGLTDRFIARQPTTRSNDQRYMAHDRRADPEYLYSRGFNMEVEQSETTRERALLKAPFALWIADDLWMPISSRKPEWVEAAYRGRPLWMWKTVREIGCFQEGVETDWTITGGAFAIAPIPDMLSARTDSWPSRGSLDFGLSSRDPVGNRKGNARSPYFTAVRGTALELRMGGTSSDSIGARLVERGGACVADIHTIDESTLSLEHFDLTPFVGRELALELYDDSDQGWLVAAGIVILEAQELSAH